MEKSGREHIKGRIASVEQEEEEEEEEGESLLGPHAAYWGEGKGKEGGGTVSHTTAARGRSEEGGNGKFDSISPMISSMIYTFEGSKLSLCCRGLYCLEIWTKNVRSLPRTHTWTSCSWEHGEKEKEEEDGRRKGESADWEETPKNASPWRSPPPGSPSSWRGLPSPPVAVAARGGGGGGPTCCCCWLLPPPPPPVPSWDRPTRRRRKRRKRRVR